MAIVIRDNQEFTAPAGETTAHLMNVYDDTTGLQATVTAAVITANHADLTGNISIAVVGGRAQVTITATSITGSTTPRWFVLKVTVGGVDITQATGTNVYIVTRVTDTITAPVTLTQDYPTSASVTHLRITGSGTVTGAGHKIDFATLYGSIIVDDGITLSDMGDAATPAINVGAIKGDGHVVLGACTFDACGQALSYVGGIFNDGYITIGAITVNSNSLVPVGSTLNGSTPQIYQHLNGNSNYPSTYDAGLKILKSRIKLDAVSHTSVAGRLSGLRCGLECVSLGFQVSIGNWYSNCQVSTNTWADVANFDTGVGQFTITGPILLRGGQWVVRAASGMTFDSNLIVSEGYSHSYIDVLGHASLDTVLTQIIILPGSTDPNSVPNNMIGRIRVRGNGSRVKIQRATVIGVVGDTFKTSAVAIDDGQTLAELTSCLFYKLQIDRGPTPVGDGCVSPCDTSEGEQTTSGSPLRPATNPNRMTTCDFNMDYQCVSVGSDTYQKYLVGTVTGSPGANDPASADPQFVGGGSYTWDETSILNGSTSVAAVWTAIRQAFTPQNSALHGTGSGGVDIGAVDVAAAAATAVSVTARRITSRPGPFKPGLAR